MSRVDRTARSFRGAALALAACVLVIGPQIAQAFPWSKDMRDQKSVKTQEMPRPQPPGAVPRTGAATVPESDTDADKLRNPVPFSYDSARRGCVSFATWCVACHGRTAVGNGPVASKFIPPPDLHGDHTRKMTDGWIYAHIRRGGPLMPSYRFAVNDQEAWDLVNYVRWVEGRRK